MSHNLLRRLGQSLLVLWAAFTLSFIAAAGAAGRRGY